MRNTNISRAKKRAQKSIGRKGKSEKRYGANKKGKAGEMTAGKLRERYFGGSGGGEMSIPSKTDQSNRSGKTNRNRFSVKAKLKRRLKSKA
jgi:hypothetical protein